MEEAHKKVIEVQENAPIKPLMQDAETQVGWSWLAVPCLKSKIRVVLITLLFKSKTSYEQQIYD